MGIFGTKETTLKINNKKVIVNPPEMTFSPKKQHPFEKLNVKKLENTKEKIKIVSLCLNGDMLPEWIKNKGNQNLGKDDQKLSNIKNGDHVLQEVLRKFLDLIIGCQDRGEEMRESWFDRIVEKKDLGTMYINVRNKKYLDKLKLMKDQINYQRECKGKNLIGMFCKLEGNFKDSWKSEVKKVIEEKIWKILKQFMIGWVDLKKVKWGKNSASINTVEWEIKNGKNKKKVQIEYGSGYTDFEIGEWWFKTGLIQKGKEAILKELEQQKSNNKNDWVDRIKFMIGRNKANIEDFFKNWLWNELEKEFSEKLKSDCGMWNRGVSCPEGGLVY
ncbi:hypothetical protein [Mycoplasma parvum]|uniref:Uncharacterized protein n=1 Tax=Mycoplasma parvum str. Indiana TaxID=1403316 RepID=U5NFV3_9MOLU|nr:hypothetical protein [Mycoplasma parvum]AGX89128.1 hypothetical protein PRV_01950 [Mycoplasma parvum str. Indiana]